MKPPCVSLLSFIVILPSDRNSALYTSELTTNTKSHNKFPAHLTDSTGKCRFHRRSDDNNQNLSLNYSTSTDQTPFELSRGLSLFSSVIKTLDTHKNTQLVNVQREFYSQHTSTSINTFTPVIRVSVNRHIISNLNVILEAPCTMLMFCIWLRVQLTLGSIFRGVVCLMKDLITPVRPSVFGVIMSI